MKKIFILIVLMITMISCSNDNPIQDFNPEETTMEQVNLAEKDTVVYKIQLSDSNEVLLVNSETNLVEKRVSNYEGATFSFFVIATILFFVLLIIIAVISSD